MTESEKKFAAAALRVFQRYGVRKATMEEIAKEAGVSKPTLYATIRNKDQALGASIRFAKGAATLAVREAWQGLDDTNPKLDVLFDRLILTGFDMLHNAPDAEAFEEAAGPSSASAITDTRNAEIDLLAEAFETHSGLAPKGVTPRDYAAFVINAGMQAKLAFKDRTELESFLASLRLSALAVLAD